MQARFFDTATETCGLCKRQCRIPAGKTGFCGVRKNTGKGLVTWTYGALAASGIDPIEKKPLYHCMPGSPTLSLSTFGCNFTCRHCQNYDLSQRTDIETMPVSPEEIIRAAETEHISIISFTYNEPTVFYEYMFDIAKLAHASGIRTAMITNGYLSEEALRELAPYLDAIRIDLKAFSESFYQDVCGGAHLTGVLETIQLAQELKLHQELVTLVIPGLNDSAEEIQSLLSWELQELGPAVPHHFTAFRPMYRMTNCREATHADLDAIWHTARDAGLYYPYVGNIMHRDGSTTFCPDCGAPLIVRAGYVARSTGMDHGHCKACGRKIEGIFD